jgi:hypothetical protein
MASSLLSTRAITTRTLAAPANAIKTSWEQA